MGTSSSHLSGTETMKLAYAVRSGKPWNYAMQWEQEAHFTMEILGKQEIVRNYIFQKMIGKPWNYVVRSYI